MNTAQQHNSTTHRYFYQLLYGLLIIICFFAYCKDDSDMVAPDDPGVVDPPEVVDPDDNKPPFVTLNLDCTEERENNSDKTEYCGDTKKITNTIKSDNLPIYTVKRVGPKDKPVTVTLMWDAAGSSGSDRPTKYDPAPRIVPFLSSLTLMSDTVTWSDRARSTCNELSDDSIDLDDYISATHYSFKFIGGPDNEAPIVSDITKNASTFGTPGTVSTPGTAGTVKVEGTLSVTIPAGSRTATFRLDPHRCPDSTTFFDLPPTMFKKYGRTSGDTVVSIGIQSISDTSGFDDMSPPKALTITFPESPAALDDGTKMSLKEGIETAFSGNTGTDTLDLDLDGNKGKLKTAQKEADKVAGKFGTEN